MPKIPAKDIPRFARTCWEEARKASEKNRIEETKRLKAYIGDQWWEEEKTKRQASQRPAMVDNRLKPAVDQIEGDIRMNPPGPECHPVGGSEDNSNLCDIVEGMIREVEFRSNAQLSYAVAGKYSAASGNACLELCTEYEDERSDDQRLRIEAIEDPHCVFFDPASRKFARTDASWAGKLKMYSRAEYEMIFGKQRKVLDVGTPNRVMGWIQDAMGIPGELAQIKEWTGNGQGPFYVCEFYMVQVEERRLRKYSDRINRFDDELKDHPLPKGVHELEDLGKRPKRTICKYLVDALEVLDETDWLGSMIPLFPVYGPEVWIDGKLHRLCLISGSLDQQRGLNYFETTIAEIAGLMTRAPWIGAKGAFDDARWATANTDPWAYLEYVPVFVTDEATGGQALAPPPIRNTYEISLQWCIQACAWFADGIKAATNIFNPSLGEQKQDQSGKAIQKLQTQANVANFSYSDNLHHVIGLLYQQMIEIFPQIYDAPRAQVIIRADGQHEIALINQIFPSNHPQAGHPKPDGNHIGSVELAVRCSAGPNQKTRIEQAIPILVQFFSTMDPQVLAQRPGIAARMLRMIGQGNPLVEEMADMMDPQANQDPQAAQMQLQQAQQQTQAMGQVIQKLQMALAAKLPDIQAKERMAALDNWTKIVVARITASKDADTAQADRESDMLQNILGMAHDRAMQSDQQQHEKDLQSSQAALAIQQQASDQAAQQQQGGVQ